MSKVMKKNIIRASVRRFTAEMDEASRRLQSHDAAVRLERVIRRHGAAVVALFSPLPDEVDISPLLDSLSDVRILLPRVEDTPQGVPCMEFYDYRADAMADGAYGIREPQGGLPCPPSEIDLMAVPGMAFTRDGRRLGRGKGYYDRYLAREGVRAWCVGVCFTHQIVDDLPCEEHDRRVDEVIASGGL